MELAEYLPALQKTTCRFDDAAAEVLLEQALLVHGWSAQVLGDLHPVWRRGQAEAMVDLVATEGSR